MKKNILLITISIIAAVSCSKIGSYRYSADNMGYPSEAGDNDFSDGDAGGDRFDQIVENPFISTASNPVSTFSVDADGAAYAYMRRSLTGSNRLPDANSVRIEEYLNYFTFDYPDPSGEDMVALNAEAGPCPWNQEHKLLRLGIKGKSLPEDQIPMANYVFLIDVSGSMSSVDKLPLLKKGLITMLEYMRSDDRVAIVTYAGHEELLLQSTPVSEMGAIKNAINSLYASGSTNGARGMQMAYEEAMKNYIAGANNRVIMGTDGDFNVGITGTDAICEFVQNYSNKGIYLTVCGFGTGNLNDGMMEKVSNCGNGTYEYIDSELEMTKVFVNERSRFISVANDCKAQITFNPATVDMYRLIGYENRVMDNNDFENDKVDAAEIGSGQTITALYEIVPTEEAGSLGTFDFRYKKELGVESQMLSYELPAVSEKTSENLLFASSLAAWGLFLRNSQYKGSANIDMAIELASDATTFDPFDLRKEYLDILRKAKKLAP